MTKRIVAAILLMALATAPAYALRRFGKIDKDFKFNRLEIVRIQSNDCRIRGQIENTSRETYTRVYFKIFAFDRDEQILWDAITVQSFGPGQTVDFSERIFGCGRETNPYDLRWEVTK